MSIASIYVVAWGCYRCDVTGNARQRFLECSIILSIIKEHRIRSFGVKAPRNDFELWILIHEYSLKRQEKAKFHLFVKFI